MRCFRLIPVLSCLLGWTAVAAADAVPETKPEAGARAVQTPEPADLPVPKMKDGVPIPGFIAIHESFIKRGRSGPIGVLFLGDSITAGWAGGGKEIWARHYGSLQAANFGISGDRTQHVLWRIANGELDGIEPKVVVLMIGTNNIRHPVDEILSGINAIIARIHAKLPKTQLLLLGIFPRGTDPKDKARDKIIAVNQALAQHDDGKSTRFLDLGSRFLDSSGVLPKDIMPDGLHPNAKGYQIWAEAMQPLLNDMLR